MSINIECESYNGIYNRLLLNHHNIRCNRIKWCNRIKKQKLIKSFQIIFICLIQIQDICNLFKAQSLCNVYLFNASLVIIIIYSAEKAESYKNDDLFTGRSTQIYRLSADRTGWLSYRVRLGTMRSVCDQCRGGDTEGFFPSLLFDQMCTKTLYQHFIVCNSIVSCFCCQWNFGIVKLVALFVLFFSLFFWLRNMKKFKNKYI